MVSCSAIGCTNRGEKGFSMKSFPKDPKIRKKWQENVNRAGWEPTGHSKLCEVTPTNQQIHFRIITISFVINFTRRYISLQKCGKSPASTVKRN